jgi:hypothetical protein
MTEPHGTGRFADIPDADLAATKSYADVARIVELMREDLIAHPNDWENATLEQFLEALAAVLDSIPHRTERFSQEVLAGPAWELIANVLIGASEYE